MDERIPALGEAWKGSSNACANKFVKKPTTSRFVKGYHQYTCNGKAGQYMTFTQDIVFYDFTKPMNVEGTLVLLRF